jgi:uncharacterized protein YneF (UPF0154 family)
MVFDIILWILAWFLSSLGLGMVMGYWLRRRNGDKDA